LISYRIIDIVAITIPHSKNKITKLKTTTVTSKYIRTYLYNFVEKKHYSKLKLFFFQILVNGNWSTANSFKYCNLKLTALFLMKTLTTKQIQLKIITFVGIILCLYNNNNNNNYYLLPKCSNLVKNVYLIITHKLLLYREMEN